MPTRKLRVSFVLDVEVLARILAHHEQMDIEVYGDEPQGVSHTKEEHKALPPASGLVWEVVLRAIAQGATKSPDIRVALEKAGYSPKSLDSAIAKLRHDAKFIERVTWGVYKLTKKGQDYVNSQTV